MGTRFGAPPCVHDHSIVVAGYGPASPNRRTMQPSKRYERVAIMSQDRVVTPLQRIQLFASLQGEQLEQIAQNAERLRFRAGDVITHAGAPADGAYLIVAGQAERMDADSNAERELIEPGSLIGEMAMLIDHEYRATIVARDRVLCLKINRTALTAQMLADPSLADGLHEQMTQRLMRTAEQLRNLDKSLANLWPEMPMAAQAGPGAYRPGLGA